MIASTQDPPLRVISLHDLGYCHRLFYLTEAEGLALEQELGFPVFATNDAKEGPRAFKEKRAPKFQGK